MHFDKLSACKKNTPELPAGIIILSGLKTRKKQINLLDQVDGFDVVGVGDHVDYACFNQFAA